MNEKDQQAPAPVRPEVLQPNNEKFRDLAQLEEEVRRRLRSNQRFLDKFLDEDFVDDEAGEDEGDDGDEEEL